MSIDTLTQSNGEYEQKPVVSYEEYRTLCDSLQPDVCRKTGIPSQEDYDIAQGDSRTVFMEIDTCRIPFFTPLECVSGYNQENCERMIESKNIFVLSLPFELLEDENIELRDYLVKLDSDAAVIIETPPSRTRSVKEDISRQVSEGIVRDFIDPRCPIEHQSAQISVYKALMDALDENGELLPMDTRPLRELFIEDVKATGNTETELVDAARIKEDEGLFEQLWELHDDKFDWLGKYHPVSMQENKEFFRKLMNDDHTVSFVRFDTDENDERVPVSLGCEIDFAKVNWLNDRFKGDVEGGIDKEKGRIRFFYGIVSKSSPEKMLHYAKDVIGLDSRLAKRSGGRTTVIFESTNMSSLYIPRILTDYTNEEPNGVRLAQEVETLSQLDYWYFKLDSGEGSKETV
jgi:hypothetical protein